MKPEYRSVVFCIYRSTASFLVNGRSLLRQQSDDEVNVSEPTSWSKTELSCEATGCNFYNIRAN